MPLMPLPGFELCAGVSPSATRASPGGNPKTKVGAKLSMKTIGSEYNHRSLRRCQVVLVRRDGSPRGSYFDAHREWRAGLGAGNLSMGDTKRISYGRTRRANSNDGNEQCARGFTRSAHSPRGERG